MRRWTSAAITTTNTTQRISRLCRLRYRAMPPSESMEVPSFLPPLSPETGERGERQRSELEVDEPFRLGDTVEDEREQQHARQTDQHRARPGLELTAHALLPARDPLHAQQRHR